ncbi:V-type proton ATPase proteolipid subunit 2 [Neolecta irregularis DAH-3]|uniref:V-type proton ATPase proteolipid subunit n=1 Tax=Neolecta irregularis (strain DAH-3) TaxID=1198029 RepID=A0A1U7LQL8_NEOID|nr:V-type proton ATPase proteolipid subunit 2 [Neolecta irregularis DAH-3]|eukprot:OLL24811.1 V-type proton ATPase proteolipid subunit 2 [Neolecta irregularis DAH-3]
MSTTPACPVYAPFFGFAGIAGAVYPFLLAIPEILDAFGAAYGTAKAGIGISGVGQFNPSLIMKSLIPVVMSGIIAVYGLVISVLIVGDMSPHANYSLFNGFIHLAAGLCVGFSGLSAGYAIGIVGDMGVRSYLKERRLFVSMVCLSIRSMVAQEKVLILIFAEVLGLYGLIVGLILNTKTTKIC